MPRESKLFLPSEETETAELLRVGERESTSAKKWILALLLQHHYEWKVENLFRRLQNGEHTSRHKINFRHINEFIWSKIKLLEFMT